MDLLVDAANKWFIKDNSGSSANFFFHDLNAKIHHKIDDKTFFYLSAYNGNDQLEQKTAGIEDRETAHNASTEKWDWGNTIVSGKLSRILTPNLFFKGTITYNRYNFRIDTDDNYENTNDSLGVQQASRNFLFSSGIKDYSAADDDLCPPLCSRHKRFSLYAGMGRRWFRLTGIRSPEQLSNG